MADKKKAVVNSSSLGSPSYFLSRVRSHEVCHNHYLELLYVVTANMHVYIACIAMSGLDAAPMQHAIIMLVYFNSNHGYYNS